MASVRPPSENELRATRVVALPLDEASAKVRTGPPKDDEEDYALAVWAGELPLRLEPLEPVADPRLAPGPTPPPARDGLAAAGPPPSRSPRCAAPSPHVRRVLLALSPPPAAPAPFAEERLLLDRRLETLRRILPDGPTASADVLVVRDLAEAARLARVEIQPRPPVESGARGEVVLDLTALGGYEADRPLLPEGSRSRTASRTSRA